MSRAVRRNRTRSRGYRPVHADCRARRRRARPQARKITCDPVLSARMLADLKRSRTTVLAAGRRQPGPSRHLIVTQAPSTGRLCDGTCSGGDLAPSASSPPASPGRSDHRRSCHVCS